MKHSVKNRIGSLLVAMMLIFGLALPAYAADGVRLRWWSPEETLPFEVGNMFPGDTVTKEYTVEVSHKKPLVLHYRADVRAGSEKLAEVLKVSISLPDKKIELYDGLRKDMPDSLDHTLAAGETKLNYTITAYLDTSVGNEYMSKALTADFRWWYLPESTVPQTGDEAPVMLYGGMLAVSVLAAAVLLKKRGAVDE